jgi:hypothetical protein
MRLLKKNARENKTTMNEFYAIAFFIVAGMGIGFAVSKYSIHSNPELKRMIDSRAAFC